MKVGIGMVQKMQKEFYGEAVLNLLNRHKVAAGAEPRHKCQFTLTAPYGTELADIERGEQHRLFARSVWHPVTGPIGRKLRLDLVPLR